MTENKENQQPQKRVEQLIFRDELTDAFNRRYLYQYLPQEIARSKGANQSIWLFMIDIDDFKSINDKYGHLRGDEVLKTVAKVLKECVRAGDTVIRYAGDEFTIVLPAGDISTITNIAKRISSTVSKTSISSIAKGQPDINVNLSLGIANFPDDAGEALRLIDLADKALYVSKQKGRNRISFVSDISSDVLRAKEILELFPCPRLIERNSQLNKLLQILENVGKEKEIKTNVILISSAVGLGKSRLMEDFSKLVIKKSGIYFLNKCCEKFISQPYRNLLLNLENYLRANLTIKERLLKNLSATAIAQLSKIFPSLQESFGSSDFAQEVNEKKEVNIEEILKQILINISLENVLCLAFDDFHWIDEKTLRLILSLKKEKAQILILAALRNEALLSLEASDYPLVHFKDELAGFVDEEIKLDFLSFPGTKEMISAILPDIERTEEFDSLVYKISKGAPLFIEELLKFLIQKGFIYYHKGHWGKIEIQELDIPHSLEEIILERFRSLDRTTQELISQAAVIGQDFNADLLHRLGKQEEGYVLDILESAKSAGLIKKNRLQEGEDKFGAELSFVSDEIRRVLYSLIEQDKMKLLHKQLGEIEEGLYSNNLDQIAGELFYHFKKAQDYHRATEYANMVKRAEGLAYDRVFKYAKEILEGVEEKLVPTLNKQSLSLIPDIVRDLYIVNINTILYPAGSEMVMSPLEDLFKKLSEIFVRDEILVLSEAKGALLVNGERLKEGQLKKMFEQAFLYYLKSCHIESITFKRGITKSDFTDFLDILTHPSEEINFTERLKSKGIYQIEVGEVSYAASASDKTEERERVEEAMLVDYILGKVSGWDKKDKTDNIPVDWESNATQIAQVLTQMADTRVGKDSNKDLQTQDNIKAEFVKNSFQKISSHLQNKNPQDWQKYKNGLAQAILNLEPKLRRDVLLSEKPEEKIIKGDIIKELFPEFPDEVVVDMLSHEFKDEKASIPKMRSLVQKFLWDNNQRQRIVPLLKDKLQRQGCQKEDLAWVLGEQSWKDFNLEERVKKFLNMTAEDYLNLEDDVEINYLISEVLALERQDLFNAVLNKWKEFFKIASIDLRRRVARSFMRVIESIPLSRQELLIVIFDIVFSNLEHEEQLDIYTLLISQFAKPIGYLIDSGNFVHAKIIIAKLKKEKLRIISSKERRLAIEELMERIFQLDRLKPVILELMKRIDSSSYYDDIKDLIINIGEVVIKPLMNEAMIDDKVLGYLGYFGAYLRRRAIGEILSELIKIEGAKILTEELKERLNHEKWYIAKNTIELFMYLQQPGFVKLLENTIKHPEINIRQKTIFVLSKIAGKESIELLIEVLNDSEATVRLNVINYLSKIADESVLAALKGYRYADFQVEIKKAVEFVEKLLGKDLKK
ncbi:MAG: diguanylate cyclase [Candidatus Omnitrophota bacterium]|nr:diguanylate cyclase [Candidatus Omnitrophota bacterium]